MLLCLVNLCVVEDDLDDPSPLWWWLVLLIQALVLSPNIEREGIQQRTNSKGDN